MEETVEFVIEILTETILFLQEANSTNLSALQIGVLHLVVEEFLLVDVGSLNHFSPIEIC